MFLQTPASCNPDQIPSIDPQSVTVGTTVPARTKRLLSDCATEYITETVEHKAAKTFAAYSLTILSFCESATGITSKRATGITPKLATDPSEKDRVRKEYLGRIAATGFSMEYITRAHLLGYVAKIRANKSSPRTVRNRIDHLQIFLHKFGVTSVLKGSDLPKYTQKKVRAYNHSDLEKMLAPATLDESDLVYFLLCTGAREQEAQFVCWTDVDLERKTYTLTEHLDLGFRPKDKEEGTLPIPDLLIHVLRERRVRHTKTRLIFPGQQGGPNGHALRIIKRLALRAGVNCVNKAGESCATHATCRHVLLHKMRKTFASTLHHNGLPAQTLQRYLRHSDLSTTIAYIADQPDDQVRETINATFTGFGG